MPATAELEPSTPIGVNPALMHAVLPAVQSGLEMCGIRVRCVGVAQVPTQGSADVTGMIGVHGSVSGFVTVSMPERFAAKAVEGLLGDSFSELTPEVIDGVGELTNIIVGGVKSSLANSEWSFNQITVPSVIVGQGYSIAYAQGLEFLNVTFEHANSDSVLLNDRLLQVSVSLLRK